MQFLIFLLAVLTVEFLQGQRNVLGGFQLSGVPPQMLNLQLV